MRTASRCGIVPFTSTLFLRRGLVKAIEVARLQTILRESHRSRRQRRDELGLKAGPTIVNASELR